MQGFRSFILLESQKVTDYLKKLPKAEKITNWLLANKKVRDFLDLVDRKSLIKPEKGKKGVLVLNKSAQYEPFSARQLYTDETSGNPFQHRITLEVTNIEGNEITLSRIDERDFSEITYKAPAFVDPRTKKQIIV